MKTAADKPLEVSVIIASRNHARSLESTLADLQRQQVEGIAWELIVVDNGSDDDTPSVLERAGERLPLIVINEPEPGQNRARNRALEIARGESGQ